MKFHVNCIKVHNYTAPVKLKIRSPRLDGVINLQQWPLRVQQLEVTKGLSCLKGKAQVLMRVDFGQDGPNNLG